MLRSFYHTVLMNADPNTGGGAGETAKVTLPGGVTVELPKADAEKILAARQKENEERTSLAQKAGAAEAERKVAEERAAAESRDKEAMKLAKDGEIVKAKEILTAEANGKLSTLTKRIARGEMETTLRRLAPNLDDKAVGDILSLTAARATYNVESGRVVVLDETGKPVVGQDGQPVGADSYLTDWLKDRPHFQAVKVPNSNGGRPAGGTAPLGSIRVADLATADKDTIAGVVSGKIKVVD